MIYFNTATALAGVLLLLSTSTRAAKVTNPNRVPKNAVLLSKVSSLTLRHGASTASRRVGAAPQLECVGPADVCKLYKVDVMRCTNEGADYDEANIQWSCKASLPEEFKLGSTDVICEGYESSDDPYVLKNSCGVEYRLLLTDKGEEKYRKPTSKTWFPFQWHSRPREEHPPSSPQSDSTSSVFAQVVFFIIFGAVLCIILVSLCRQANQRGPRRGGGRTTGGGGGNNDNDDPPPPYDGPPSYYDSPPRKPKTKQQSQPANSRSTRNTTASSSRTVPQRQENQAWRPGFWTGTAAGAAAAYLASNRNRAQQPPPQRPETQERAGGLFSSFLSPGQETRTQPRPAPQAPSYPDSPNSSPNYSSTRHESTGFGSTRRR